MQDFVHQQYDHQISPVKTRDPRDHDFDHMMQEAQEIFFGGPCDTYKTVETPLWYMLYILYTSIICIIFVYTSDLFIIFWRCWIFFFLEGRPPDFYFMNFQLQLRCWGRTTCISTSRTVELRVFHGENGGGPLGWYPSRLPPSRSPLKGDIYIYIT